MFVGSLVLVAFLGLVPTPYYLLAPGSAVDLSRRISVEGRTPPHRSFYLTDVSVSRASLLLLASALVPGTSLVEHDRLLPPGETLRSYDRVLSAAMDDSQRIAAYVAERAAGYRIGAPEGRVSVVGFAPGTRAKPMLAIGDRLVSVGGRRIEHPADVADALRQFHSGVRIHVVVQRGKRDVAAEVPAIATPAGTRLGIAIVERDVVPQLPVPVHFSLDGVEGSSGGLMLALAVYAELHGDHRNATPVAGTGTISPDGVVGEIEGTQQKVIAAERAGARVFLVPRKNYADIAHERGIRIIPVDTFAGALAALPS